MNLAKVERRENDATLETGPLSLNEFDVASTLISLGLFSISDKLPISDKNHPQGIITIKVPGCDTALSYEFWKNSHDVVYLSLKLNGKRIGHRRTWHKGIFVDQMVEIVEVVLYDNWHVYHLPIADLKGTSGKSFNSLIEAINEIRQFQQLVLQNETIKFYSADFRRIDRILNLPRKNNLRFASAKARATFVNGTIRNPDHEYDDDHVFPVKHFIEYLIYNPQLTDEEMENLIRRYWKKVTILKEEHKQLAKLKLGSKIPTVISIEQGIVQRYEIAKIEGVDFSELLKVIKQCEPTS